MLSAEKCELVSCTYHFLRFRQFLELFLVSHIQIHFFFAIFKGCKHGSNVAFVWKSKSLLTFGFKFTKKL